jgi:hypothetical protein
MSAAIPPVRLVGLLQLLRSRPAEPTAGDAQAPAARLAAGAFEQMVLEALLTRAARVESPTEVVAAAAAPAEAVPERGVGAPSGEESSLIAREAGRTGVDPALLMALRRTENGGAGREFGVLSVDAPTEESQARIAANTVKNSLTRYQRQGGEAVDPATGRYSEGFLRFLSARYAPVGAENDPTGLNRHHAANLISLYRKASGGAGRG